MIFAAWVVLAGLGLYVHGLFSEELLEWTGALIIAIGIGMLAFRLNVTASQWVAASTLGLGLPLLSAMLDRGRQRAAWVRLLQSVGWLLCVLLPPLLAQRLASAAVPPDCAGRNAGRIPQTTRRASGRRPARGQQHSGQVRSLRQRVPRQQRIGAAAGAERAARNHDEQRPTNRRLALPRRKLGAGTRNELDSNSLDKNRTDSANRAGDTRQPGRGNPASNPSIKI